MEESNRNLFGRLIPIRTRWRKFGAIKVLGSVRVVVMLSAVNERERCASTGKGTPISIVRNLRKIEVRRWRSIWRTRSRNRSAWYIPNSSCPLIY